MKAITLFCLVTAGLLAWLYFTTGAEPGISVDDREKLNMTVGGLVVGVGLAWWLRAALRS